MHVQSWRRKLPRFNKHGQDDNFRNTARKQINRDHANLDVFLFDHGWMRVRKWFAYVQIALDDEQPIPAARSSVDIDVVGVRFAVLSKGSHVVLITSFK
ncbi:MAG TPA: hypothetical protein VJQ54_11915 [Candidatus Sulfotelmatobacter sp.]|nr:hypothetical protein [Candidatus Sulfotelmatobacter sp.]